MYVHQAVVPSCRALSLPLPTSCLARTAAGSPPCPAAAQGGGPYWTTWPLRRGPSRALARARVAGTLTLPRRTADPPPTGRSPRPAAPVRTAPGQNTTTPSRTPSQLKLPLPAQPPPPVDLHHTASGRPSAPLRLAGHVSLNDRGRGRAWSSRQRRVPHAATPASPVSDPSAGSNHCREAPPSCAAAPPPRRRREHRAPRRLLTKYAGVRARRGSAAPPVVQKAVHAASKGRSKWEGLASPTRPHHSAEPLITAALSAWYARRHRRHAPAGRCHSGPPQRTTQGVVQPLSFFLLTPFVAYHEKKSTNGFRRPLSVVHCGESLGRHDVRALSLSRGPPITSTQRGYRGLPSFHQWGRGNGIGSRWSDPPRRRSFCPHEQ